MVKVYFINIFNYRFSIMLNKVDKENDLGKLLATIDIKEKGTSTSIHDEMNPRAKLLAAAHSEQFIIDWSNIARMDEEKYAALERLVRTYQDKNIIYPFSHAIYDLGLHNNIPEETKDNISYN